MHLFSILSDNRKPSDRRVRQNALACSAGYHSLIFVARSGVDDRLTSRWRPALHSKSIPRLLPVNKKLALRLMTVVSLSAFSALLLRNKNRGPRRPAPSRTGNYAHQLAARLALRTEAQAIESDFEEALRVIERHYVDGSRLDYNSVFKSSIIGHAALARSAFELLRSRRV